MIPGEYFLEPDPIEINAGRPTVTIAVANTGDRPIQVGSHCHFFEVNRFFVVIAALKAFADQGEGKAKAVAEAIKKYGINADKINPLYA